MFYSGPAEVEDFLCWELYPNYSLSFGAVFGCANNNELQMSLCFGSFIPAHLPQKYTTFHSTSNKMQPFSEIPVLQIQIPYCLFWLYIMCYCFWSVLALVCYLTVFTLDQVVHLYPAVFFFCVCVSLSVVLASSRGLILASHLDTITYSTWAPTATRTTKPSFSSQFLHPALTHHMFRAYGISFNKTSRQSLYSKAPTAQSVNEEPCALPPVHCNQARDCRKLLVVTPL